MDNEPTSSMKVVLCDICKHKDETFIATFFCVICRFLFCDECSTRHRNLDHTKDHMLVEIKTNTPEKSKDTEESTRSNKACNTRELHVPTDINKLSPSTDDDVVDSDYVHLEAFDTRKAFYESFRQACSESPRLKKISEFSCPGLVRNIFCFPDGRIGIVTDSKIRFYSQEYSFLFEMECPFEGFPSHATGNQIAILNQQKIERIEIGKNNRPKSIGFIGVSHDGEVRSFSADDEFYFFYTHQPDYITSHDCFYIYDKSGFLVSSTRKGVCSSRLRWITFVNRTAYFTDGHYVTTMNIYCKGNSEKFAVMFTNLADGQGPRAFFVDDDYILHVADTKIDEKEVSCLAVKNIKSGTRGCVRLTDEKTSHLGALAIQQSLSRILVEINKNIQVFALEFL